MTTTHDAARIRRIGEERASALALASGPQQGAALLHVDVLEYIRDCQQLRDTGVSAACAKIDNIIGGVANPNRPFLTWDCCDAHRALKLRREELKKRAAELGVEINLDMTQVIED